jgi:LacI family transcriptional regulator
MRKVSISDVAARAGVSRATADRVLNRRGGVSPDKVRAVLMSARAIGLDRNLDMAPVKLLRVGVLMQPPQNPFYERLARGFREANDLFSGQAIKAYVSHIDVLAPERIKRQLRQMARLYDALVIVAPAREGILDVLRPIAARLTVVTLASDLPLDAAHYYVGPDNYKAGRLAGELMGRLLGAPGGRVLLIAGLSTFSGHGERRQGFLDVLAEDFPRCRVSAEIESFEQPQKAVDGVVAALRRDGDIAGIYNISQGNDAIAERITPRARRRPITFICHDLTSTSRNLLMTRAVDAVIDQDPILEARRAIEIILQHHGRLSGRQVTGATPLRVVFRENADELS